MPTMRGLPVEEHIRGVVKDLLRARGVAHKGLEEDIYGTKRVPLKGLKYRLSVQVRSSSSSSTYVDATIVILNDKC